MAAEFAPSPDTFAMVIAEKPLSANRGRPSPRYTGVIHQAARAQGARLLTGQLYVRIVWFQRLRTDGDVDNIAKLILDSLKGVVIRDDDDVVRCLTQKAVADGNGEYVYDPRLIPAEAVQTALQILLGAASHVVYIEVGAIVDQMIAFGPVT